MKSVRLDALLVNKALCHSRTHAQALISEGKVEVKIAGDWEICSKASKKIAEDAELKVSASDTQKYVSRAGLKLEAALRKADISLDGMCALDVGQSTGGFTDCLLQHGISKVVGVDVGHSQLVRALASDPRVFCYENINARELDFTHIRDAGIREFDLIVMDVSFISQTLILPRLIQFMKSGGHLISLVKPQFEVGPEGIGKGGMVKHSDLYQIVEEKIREAVTSLGLTVSNYFESVIKGGDGNTEFFIVCRSS
ncbi:TlyA family RNA methyltransferase [Teredinibacter sp. KSP-S5-2]|uniref:TlyA family RNA methyltransferase n=1 Tax=Teredinibacter sp. KSP-S5-2 TaxID=3034506 RepID=UPI002934B785|nr:TlyA family RNA methyltransferase [Teredinibacter sp. KSP-S5-2]WNO09106.1 TlyA family RNA methyltransferase [Teredinibacter sp. KSP-S5-2]